MGYKCSFMDNESYTAQDVNERFSAFFTEGVILAESGNVLSDLNTVTSDISTEGVIPGGCRVIKSDNTYKITKGTCIMQDGSAITFDDDGYELSLTPFAYNYVYLKRNEPENTIDVIVSTESPSGEFVPICEVNSSGDIFDRRAYSTLKLNSPQEGTLKNFTHDFYSTDNFEEVILDVGCGNFSYVIIWGGTADYTNTSFELDTHEKCVQPIEDGNVLRFTMIDNAGYTEFLLFLEKDGQYIKVNINPTNGSLDFQIRFAVI